MLVNKFFVWSLSASKFPPSLMNIVSSKWFIKVKCTSRNCLLKLVSHTIKLHPNLKFYLLKIKNLFRPSGRKIRKFTKIEGDFYKIVLHLLIVCLFDQIVIKSFVQWYIPLFFQYNSMKMKVLSFPRVILRWDGPSKK